MDVMSVRAARSIKSPAPSRTTPAKPEKLTVRQAYDRLMAEGDLNRDGAISHLDAALLTGRGNELQVVLNPGATKPFVLTGSEQMAHAADVLGDAICHGQ